MNVPLFAKYGRISMKNVPQNGNGVPESGKHVPPRSPAEMSFNELVATVEMIEANSAWRPDWAPSWSREIVFDRIEAAIKLVQRATGRVGPKGYGSAMPAYLYSQLDLWYQQTQTDEEREKGDFARNRVVRPATTHEIALAEEALEWPKRYVGDENARAALHLWMLSCAVRVPFKKVLHRRGIAQRTGIHRRDRAIALIVYGLVIDGVEVREQ